MKKLLIALLLLPLAARNGERLLGGPRQ